MKSVSGDLATTSQSLPTSSFRIACACTSVNAGITRELRSKFGA
jgi:hypothetical protein